MAEKINFEQQNTKLEAILEKLQDPKLDIEEAIKLHKEGEKIIKDLTNYLETAEITINKQIDRS